MKVSFVIPTFNCAETIEACLKSVERQLEPGDELIIVDNGSRDKTLDIISSLSVADEVLICPDVKVGQLRNNGVERAAGEIIAFVDSDCVLASGWRSSVIVHFSKDDVDALGSRYTLPDNPHWIEKAWFSKGAKGSGLTNYINAGNFAVKRTVFISSGGFDGALSSGEDAEFCLRLSKSGYVIMSYEDVKAVHLGNPKSIRAFFRQQYWHSLGMLGTFRLQPFDKPLIATLVFLPLLVASFSLLLSSQIIWALFSALTVPFFTTLYRCYSCADFSFVPQLVFLYVIYFVARVLGLFRIVLVR